MPASLNQPTCEYILVVATSTEEQELRAAADQLGIPFAKKSSPGGVYFDLDRLGGGAGNRVIAVRVEMGPFGYAGSAGSAIRYKQAFAAQGLICLGMAFGVDASWQKPGEVLVSRALLPYDSRDVVCDPHVHSHYRYDYSRMKAFPARRQLLGLFERHHEIRPPGVHAVHFGALLTGASRVFCSRYRDKLVEDASRAISSALVAEGKIVPRIVGGEMEGMGLLSSCKRDDPSWIVVKGISDFADGDEEGRPDRRKLACSNSAVFVLQALLAEGHPAHG